MSVLVLRSVKAGYRLDAREVREWRIANVSSYRWAVEDLVYVPVGRCDQDDPILVVLRVETRDTDDTWQHGKCRLRDVNPNTRVEEDFSNTSVIGRYDGMLITVVGSKEARYGD